MLCMMASNVVDEQDPWYKQQQLTMANDFHLFWSRFIACPAIRHGLSLELNQRPGNSDKLWINDKSTVSSTLM